MSTCLPPREQSSSGWWLFLDCPLSLPGDPSCFASTSSSKLQAFTNALLLVSASARHGVYKAIPSRNFHSKQCSVCGDHGRVLSSSSSSSSLKHMSPLRQSVDHLAELPRLRVFSKSISLSRFALSAISSVTSGSARLPRRLMRLILTYVYVPPFL